MEKEKFDILIVDDMPANLKLLSSILVANGYKVRPTSNGSLALRSVKSKLPDLILLDIKMPEMNGYEVCKKLKEDKETKDIPVIFISAMDDIKDKVEAFRVGGVDYITKPFDSDEVLARVKTHLKITTLQKKLQRQNQILRENIKKQHKQEELLIEQSKMIAISEMIRSIAHQWRQPLNVIALYIQSIQESFEYGDLTKEAIDEMVVNSMKQIEFMSETIDDFRDYFKPNDREEKFSILNTIKKILSLVEAQLKSYNIEVELKGEDIVVFGYPNSFRQVIMSLINNSKDAILAIQKRDLNFKGYIKISLKDGDNEYKVTISDNGGGIDKKNIQKIFEPYFTTKFQNQGTGIGLYMVREIIERHYSGKIKVSNSDEGAIFEITIPK